MKKGIHPNYNSKAQVTCSCGNTFTVGSVTDTLQVDICNKCHPFFTGEMKFVDRQGRVDKFMKKMQAAKAIQSKAKTKKTKGDDQQAEQKSYRDILRQQQTVMKQAKKTEKAPLEA
jgi:large subunit ribosomal protein L31